MILIFLLLNNARPEAPAINWLAVYFTIFAVTIISLYYVLRYIETLYAQYYKRPFFIHLYFRTKKIAASQKKILEPFPFYQKLNKKEKIYFEHRIYRFLGNTRMYGREGQQVDDKVRITIAMIAVMLTFGMRNYLLGHLEKVIVYPGPFYSVINKTENKGEFNPRLKSLVLSWKDFVAGNNDSEGVNLGIHELTHAIHFNSIKNNDISSEIFYDTFLLLEKHLGDAELRTRLNDSNILREYAYTDKFEFMAVLIEVFIESPENLRQQFPGIYALVKQMLNFRFTGY